MEVTEYRNTQILQGNLEKIIHPRGRGRYLGRSSVFDVLTEVAYLMRKHQERAQVNDHHLAWFDYHAVNPDAVIISTDPSCKAAVDAANRALEIHMADLRRK